METQKAVFLIVGVFVAGLVLGYVFSGGADTTGLAYRRYLGGSGDDGGSLTCYCSSSDSFRQGCKRMTDPKVVTCGGSSYVCSAGWICS